MNNILLLASSSSSRQQLLTDACIPFTIVPQVAEELAPDSGLPLQELVERIATAKMDHVVMPAGVEGDIAFVLTADTLTQYASGVIAGKPVNKEHAIEQIKAARAGQIVTATAFCLEKKEFKMTAGAGSWHSIERVIRYVPAQYQFIVPDEWIERYFELSKGYQGSGAIAIEGFGSLFLKEVQGSYSAIVGLPLYELREELNRLRFFD